MNPETLHHYTLSDEQRKRKVSYTDDDDGGLNYAQLLYASPITNIQQQEPTASNYINGGCEPSIVSCPCVNCDCGWLDQAAINKGATEEPDLDALPIGYRFVPTDVELITQYLEKKIKNEDVPKARINDADIYDDHPEELVGKYPQAIPDGWYFFTPRNRKYPNGARPDRQAGTGYWKATGPDKIIKENEKRIGRRKSLVYHEGHTPHFTKTKWMMHEYVIEGYLRRSRLNSNDNKLDDYVLCKIYINGRMKDEVVIDDQQPCDASKVAPTPQQPPSTPPPCNEPAAPCGQVHDMMSQFGPNSNPSPPLVAPPFKEGGDCDSASLLRESIERTYALDGNNDFFGDGYQLQFDGNEHIDVGNGRSIYEEVGVIREWWS